MGERALKSLYPPAAPCCALSPLPPTLVAISCQWGGKVAHQKSGQQGSELPGTCGQPFTRQVLHTEAGWWGQQGEAGQTLLPSWSSSSFPWAPLLSGGALVASDCQRLPFARRIWPWGCLCRTEDPKAWKALKAMKSTHGPGGHGGRNAPRSRPFVL